MSESFGVIAAPIKCPYCDKVFESDTAYSYHIQSHKGKAGRVFSLTDKGKKAFEVWDKHLKEIEKELSDANLPIKKEPTK
jgi:uncharacterized C2H2 Zn-finger protein